MTGLRERFTRRAGVLAAAVALCAATVAGCGGQAEDNGGDQEAERAEVSRIARLFANSEPEVCDDASRAFLKRYFAGSKRDCRRSAQEDSKAARATNVELAGDTATADIRDGDSNVGLTFSRERGRWVLDSVSEPDGEGGPSAARGAVQAFVQAADEDDESVLCGLLSEKFARTIVGVKRDGIANCVRALKGQSLGALRKRFGNAKIDSVDARNEKATVRLDNEVVMTLERDDGRYVIAKVSSP